MVTSLTWGNPDHQNSGRIFYQSSFINLLFLPYKSCLMSNQYLYVAVFGCYESFVCMCICEFGRCYNNKLKTPVLLTIFLLLPQPFYIIVKISTAYFPLFILL